MKKVAIVYWSGTGNTEAMANQVLTGAQAVGAQAELFQASEFSADQMDSFDSIAFGCPSMGAEQLEEGEFEPMFSSWGDGEWMRNWEETCRNDGANLVADFVICNDAPDEDACTACQELGKALAQ